MDYKQYLEFTHDQDYIDLYKYYSTETFFDIVGVARQENPHSSFWRWLLDKNSAHGLHEMPFRKFLETVAWMKEKRYLDDLVKDYFRSNYWKSKTNILSDQNEAVWEEIRYGRFSVEKMYVQNEAVLDKQRRADIVIVVSLRLQDSGVCPEDMVTEDGRINLFILIENKVSSKEHSRQTEKYVEDLSKKEVFAEAMVRISGGAENDITVDNCFMLYVYLNAHTNYDLKKALSDASIGKSQGKYKNCMAGSKEYITLTYQYLLDGVLEPLLGISCSSEINTRLNEYIRCLGQAKIKQIDSGVKGETTDQDEYLIMAVSTSEKEKARRLLEKYYDVIFSVVNSIGTNNFELNEADRSFWRSLINLYGLQCSEFKKGANSEEWISRLDDLEKVVNEISQSSSLQLKEYRYEGIVYRSRSANSVGMLCRKLLSDYVEIENKNGKDIKQELEHLRELLQDRVKSRWLREVLLFDKEIQAKNWKENPSYFDKDYKEHIVDNDKKYISTCMESFMYHFFGYWTGIKDKSKWKYDNTINDPLAIVLPDGEKVYVAKFWSDYALKQLLKIFVESGCTEFKDKVEFL